MKCTGGAVASVSLTFGFNPHYLKKKGKKEGKKKLSKRQLTDVFENVDKTLKFSSLLVNFGNPHQDDYILEVQQYSSKQRGL